MTIDEAIERLEDSFHFNKAVKAVDLIAAKRLGIKALEEVKRLRLRIPLRLQRPLEGETEEVK